jgi:hypothetical protein
MATGAPSSSACLRCCGQLFATARTAARSSALLYRLRNHQALPPRNIINVVPSIRGPGSICACPPYAHTSPLLPVHPLCMCAPALCSIIGSQEDWRGLVAAICSSRYDPIAPQRPLDHVPKGQGLYLRRLRRDGRCHEAGEFLRDVVLRHVGGGAQVGTPRRHGRRAACAVASHGHAVARRRRDLRLRWPGQGQALQRQLRVLHLAFRVEHQGVRRHGPAPALPPHGQPDQV